jgi:hypothetical protein
MQAAIQYRTNSPTKNAILLHVDTDAISYLIATLLLLRTSSLNIDTLLQLDTDSTS